MEIILKVLIRLALIPVIVWGVQFIIALVQGTREGIQELREENRQEELERSEETEKLEMKVVEDMIQPPEEQVSLLERMTIALACPFRAIQINTEKEGISHHLQKLGCLDEEQKESLKRVLSRDFDFIFDAKDTDSIGIQMFDHLSSVGDSEWGTVMTASVSLHIITACIDLGYVQFDDCRNLILSYMKTLRNCNLHSWNEYAKQFLKEEKEAKLNRGLGRMLLKYQTERLLEKEDSPWTNLSWELIMDLQLESSL